jgi:hypothetical protein
MPPIIIACGCACGRGTGYFAGLGHVVNAGWPLPPPGAIPAQTFVAQGSAGPSTFASRAPSFQPPSPAAVPAGGISFAVQASTASGRPDFDGEFGVAP